MRRILDYAMLDRFCGDCEASCPPSQIGRIDKIDEQGFICVGLVMDGLIQPE